MKIINKVVVPKLILASELRQGQVGIVDPDSSYSSYRGLHLMRAYDTILALENGDTWTTSCSLKVTPLPAGTQLTLELDDGTEVDADE